MLLYFLSQVKILPSFVLFSFSLHKPSFGFQVRPERCRRVWVGASDQQEEVTIGVLMNLKGILGKTNYRLKVFIGPKLRQVSIGNVH